MIAILIACVILLVGAAFFSYHVEKSLVGLYKTHNNLISAMQYMVQHGEDLILAIHEMKEIVECYVDLLEEYEDDNE